MTRRLTQAALGLLGLATVAHFAYWRGLHPRLARWGATDEEIARRMPGDGQVPEPTAVTNRAVTIHAPAETVWPWLEQMGDLPRGGYYSYLWVERLLGMQVGNADQLLTGLEPLHVGDALDPPGNMRVRELQRGRALVLGPPEGQPWGDSSWSICLYSPDQQTTRLVSRVRVYFKPTLTNALVGRILGPGQFIMERKWLLGVRDRAERAHRKGIRGVAGEAGSSATEGSPTRGSEPLLGS